MESDDYMADQDDDEDAGDTWCEDEDNHPYDVESYPRRAMIQHDVESYLGPHVEYMEWKGGDENRVTVALEGVR